MTTTLNLFLSQANQQFSHNLEEESKEDDFEKENVGDEEVAHRLMSLEQKFKEFSKKQKELDQIRDHQKMIDERNYRRGLSSENDLDRQILNNQLNDCSDENEDINKDKDKQADYQFGLQREISEGRLGDIRFSEALNWYLEGRCHLEGHGIEQNIDEALHWLGKSAEKGEPRALHCLGELCEKGVGQRINKDQAY
mmetsp:Transcript_23859/g.23541  ORF Transcript_23859/g.23541 Transcript_23859/m.23541 type:complete len:196 (-) Transcript_23859:196-783(-)